MNCLWEANGKFVCENQKQSKKQNQFIENFEQNNINNYWQNSTDYPGNDIGGDYVKNTDRCKILCINDQRCIAAVYANNNNNPYCWLKGGLDKNSKITADDRNTWFKIDGSYKQTCKNCKLPAYDGNPNVLSCQCKNASGGWNRNANLFIPNCGATNNISNQNGDLQC
jgi:hypothetical protein